MTEQPGGVPPFDPANPYIQQVPTMVTFAVVDVPGGGGQRLAMTFRTPDTTFTTIVDKRTGENWHKLMGQHLEQMTSLEIPRADFTLPGVPG